MTGCVMSTETKPPDCYINRTQCDLEQLKCSREHVLKSIHLRNIPSNFELPFRLARQNGGLPVKSSWHRTTVIRSIRDFQTITSPLNNCWCQERWFGGITLSAKHAKTTKKHSIVFVTRLRQKEHWSFDLAQQHETKGISENMDDKFSDQIIPFHQTSSALNYQQMWISQSWPTAQKTVKMWKNITFAVDWPVTVFTKEYVPELFVNTTHTISLRVVLYATWYCTEIFHEAFKTSDVTVEFLPTEVVLHNNNNICYKFH